MHFLFIFDALTSISESFRALGWHLGDLGHFLVVFGNIGVGHGSPAGATWDSHRGGGHYFAGIQDARLEGARALLCTQAEH